MRASQILQNTFSEVFSSLHAYRRNALALSVDALVGCGRLVLTDLARRCDGYVFVKPALKRMDRLLSNPHLHAERVLFFRALARQVVHGPNPVILIDWSPLKDGRDFYLLRAVVPASGRAITVLESVHPAAEQASREIERAFLHQLAAILPAGAVPIIVTDAGFRGPWCRSVAALGWHWITRLRHSTQVSPAAHDAWIPGKNLQSLANLRPRDAGLFDVVRSAPLTARIVLYRSRKRHRRDTNRNGSVARNKRSRSMATREAEAWVLLCSPTLPLSARRIVNIYAKRMQIEQTFRDLKSTRHGCGFECSLTRKIERIEILLLIQMLAVFVMWLAGLIASRDKLDARLQPCSSQKRLYSMVRMGREALIRGWLAGHHPPPREALRALLPCAIQQGNSDV